MSNTRRALFRSTWLPWALVLPQLLIIFVFFYWPTGEALYWAFTLEQPWGGANAASPISDRPRPKFQAARAQTAVGRYAPCPTDAR